MTLEPLDIKGDDSGALLKLLHEVKERLQADLLACDAQWTLFVATATSYRYESIMSIFAKDFENGSQELKIDAICETIAEVPRLEMVLQQLRAGNVKYFSPQVAKLLHKVLVGHGDCAILTTLRPCEFLDLYDHLEMPVPQNAPTQIYEVMANKDCPIAKAHAELRKKDYPARLGFYGGKLEDLYAIIMTGSVPNEEEPVVLTTDVDEALAISPPGAGWGGSRCGSVLQSVAVVEFIHMPSHVTVVEGNRHVRITNSSCIQISYLLFYGLSYNAYEELVVKPHKRLLKWADNNRYSLSMVVYLLGLSFISRTGGGVFRRFVHTGFQYFKRSLLQT